MLGLTELLRHFVELVGRDELLVVKVFLAVVVHLGLLQIDVGQTHAGLCIRQRPHVGNHLYFGDDLACLDIVACLLQNLGDDTRNLGFDIDLIAGFNFACDDSGLA